MNVICKYVDEEVIVKTDNGDKKLPSYDNLLDILVNENVLELLEHYFKHDIQRYRELKSKKDSMDDFGFFFGMGCCAVASVSFVLGSRDILSDSIASPLGVGAIVATSTYGIINTLVPENKERLGLRECLKYERDRKERLVEKIASLKGTGVVVKKDIEEELVDDREAKEKLNTILNFIFYMGSHRAQIKRVVKNMRLHSFLYEKFNITDIDVIIEIENYVYREFADVFEKASGYVIKK